MACLRLTSQFSRRTLTRAAATPLALGLLHPTASTLLAQPATPVTNSFSDAVRQVVESAQTEMDLRAVLVHMTQGDETITSFAIGESMTGVPATTDMYFRNGAVAISLVSTLLLILVDEGVLALDDTIDQWLPELPDSDQVTLEMLANMTAGYRDYVQSPELINTVQDDPFAQLAIGELLGFSFSQPRLFAPGTNWEYAHTAYVMLGVILEGATDTPVDELMTAKVLEPLGLTHTFNSYTPSIPEPVLHAFTSERRAWLQIPEDVRFYEESTFWNPSWTITRGAVQTSTIADMAAAMAAVGKGTLLSPESSAAQLNRDLVGFGAPLDGCNSCRTLTEEATYGLGVWLNGPWALQNPLFSGYSGTAGYRSDLDIALAVAVTYGEGSFNAAGDYINGNASTPIFKSIDALLTDDGATPVAG